MIRIACEALYATVTCSTEEEAEWVRSYTTVYGKFNPIKGTHEQIIALWKNDRLHGGIIPVLQKVAAREGIELEVNDPWVSPFGKVETVTTLDGKPMRPYQVEAARAATMHRRLIIEAPTGAGKTLIGASLAAGADGRVLVLAPSPTLLTQWLGVLQHNGVDCALMKNAPSHARVVLATFSLVHRRLASLLTWLRSFSCVIVDEVQTAAADSHRLVLEACDRAHRRIGLSGTPLDRADGLGAVNVALTGPVLHKVPTALLIEEEAISKPEIRMREFRHKSPGSLEHTMLRMKWGTRYAKHVVNNKARNAFVVETVGMADKPAIVFAQEIDHVHILRDALEAAGHNVGIVTGKSTGSVRETLKSQVRSGHLDVLVSSRVFEVGVDIPEAQSIVNAGAMKAVIGSIQRMGRGMRTTETKKTFQMWDIYDRVYQALEKQAAARCKAYREQGHEVIIEKAATEEVFDE